MAAAIRRHHNLNARVGEKRMTRYAAGPLGMATLKPTRANSAMAPAINGVVTRKHQPAFRMVRYNLYRKSLEIS